MNKAYVDSRKCDSSPMCPARRSCPEKAISQEKLGILRRGAPVVDPEKCVSCGVCLKMCPHGAIAMRAPSTGSKSKKKKK
ncbi:MAG: 4Fe-4S binding protein [Bacillota bacterium]|nr:4Fe-4S binding protein [Bacillota bacterium]MDP4160291.1 4Fe-4S binding protein [Bacillota bacterium]